MKPPNKIGALLHAPVLKLQLRVGYRLLALLQAPFGFVFWLIEQRKARLQDRIENERSAS
jgi:hypothetical protein